MKYIHTDEPNIKINPVSKTYVFRRGSIEKSLKTKDWKTALLRKDLILSEVDFAGEVAFKHLFGGLWCEYVEIKRKQRDGKLPRYKQISHNTFREIEHIGKNQLVPYFGKMKLGKINAQSWRKFCDWADVGDLSNHRKVMSGFLKWCMEKGYVQAMPMMRIPYHTRRKRRIIKPDELEKIFEHASGPLLVFLSLALFNGLRRKEIMTLTKKSVHAQERYIVISELFNKKRRERSLPINDLVAKLIEARIASLPTDTPWVFPNREDRKRHADVGGLKKSWATVLKRAGLKDIQFHDFRATFEKHLNKKTEFTDMQKEKFADASLDVQSRVYVSMDHEDLKGLETAVNLPKLARIIESRSGQCGVGK